MDQIQNARVLIVGGSSGIAQRLAEDLLRAGAHVMLAGRNPEKTAAAARALGADVQSLHIDLGDEATIAAAAADIGHLDHVVSLASAPAQGPLQDADRGAILSAFEAKVLGPMLLAKHLAGRMREGGAFVVFSGVAAWRPQPGGVVTATTNGAVAFLVRALAVELAPRRAVAISPGVVDSGQWDGPDKESFFRTTEQTVPARRVGAPEDISAAVQLALSNPFITGTTLHIDGGASAL